MEERPSDEKAMLRARVKLTRDATTTEWRMAAARAVERHLAGVVGPLGGRTVMSYLAFGTELDLDGFHDRAIRAGAALVVPRVNGPVIEAVAYLPGTGLPGTELPVSRFGIREPVGEPIDPVEIDIVLVPALCFDRRGHRLGYGAGYYDRFLPSTSPDALIIGVVFALQVVDRVPDEPHDHPVPVIVTDEEVIVVGHPPCH